MIPDNVAASIQKLSNGTGTDQDKQIALAWFAVHQSELSNADSANFSSALGRGSAITAGSQIGLGNQHPSGSYVNPGTPSGLPSSGGNPITPDFGAGRITSGIPATPLNLEAVAGGGVGGPSQIPTHGMGMPFDFGSSPTEGEMNPGPVSDAEMTRRQSLFSRLPQNPGGAGIAANPGHDPNYGNTGFENNDISAFYQDLTSGTPLAGMGPAGIDMISRHPEVFAKMLSDQAGGGVNTQAFITPRAEAAMKMAGMGMLGHATRGMGLPGHNLKSSPSSDVEKMLVAQEFMDQFSQPGTQFADVGAMFGDEFNRVSNTDFEGLTDPNGQPLGIEGSIELTNKALSASLPFMSQETQAWISSTLNAAAVQYMTDIATGKTDISYPAYLKSLGVDQMLSGVQ